MSKILLKAPIGQYKCELDTQAMTVEIQEAFLGVTFVTKDGEKLRVWMRDNGFEVGYEADFGETGFQAGITEFKDGHISTPTDRKRNERTG